LKNEKCVASGPGRDMFESTKIIGFRQYSRARELYSKAVTQLSGQIQYIHQTVNMSDVTVVLADNTTVKTCKPAMGYSFAAGTTDGPGAFDFHQGLQINSINLIKLLHLH
jgi:neutral ceramidase